MTNTTTTQTAHLVPWMMDGLFPHDDQGRVLAAGSVEVRPVYVDADDDGACIAGTRGDTVKASFWSVYLRSAPDAVKAVADLPSEQAADAIAEALLLTYPGLAACTGLHAPIRSWDIADAAQCLWELVGAALGQVETRTAWQDRVNALYDAHGMAAVRGWMLDLARPCHTAYVRAVELDGYGDSFDWEWCPAFLASLDWAGDCAPSLPPHDPDGPVPADPSAPLAAFLKDARRLGFGGDEPVDYQDAVDMVVRHFDALEAASQTKGA